MIGFFANYATKIGFLIAISLLHLFNAQPVTAAASSDLRVLILPKDCVFDVIDAGSQELIYYTPEKCGIPSGPVEQNQPSPSTTPVDMPNQPSSQQRPALRPDIISAPTINPESNGIIIDGSIITLSGMAAPSSQVNIYVDGKLAGSVFANENGQWTFRYKALSSPVVFRLEACLDGVCSVLGDSIIVDVELDECSTTFSLTQYRYWDMPVHEPLFLQIVDLTTDGVLTVDWDDKTIETYDLSVENTESPSHLYTRPGQYNARLTLRSGDCSYERSLSIAVVSSTNWRNYWWLILAPLAVGAAGYYHHKLSQAQSTAPLSSKHRPK
jgi:hypothetical protein